MRVVCGLLVLLTACDPVRPSVGRFTCDAPIEGPDSRLLLVGEVHGTRESPELVGRLACSSASKGPTSIGLEIPASEQDSIDAFLKSDGSEESRTRLLSGPFWQTGTDGRASVAMVDLLDSVRALIRDDAPITVFAFEVPSASSRDAALAKGIRDFRLAKPDATIIALMGNMHASQAVLQPGDRQSTPAGLLLADLDPTSLLIVHRSGTVWACMPDCGVHQVEGKPGDARAEGYMEASPMPGYTRSYVLARTTASPPAVMP